MAETISLIIPDSIFLIDSRVFPSLGILKIAAVLETAGYTVEVLDLSGVANWEDAVRLHASTSRATWHGLTATTPLMPGAHKIADVIRSVSKTPIMLGGPHPTLVGAALKREQKLGKPGRATKAMASMQAHFDAIVCGDGESAVFEVIRNGEMFVDADNPKGPLFMTDEMYEASPFPARHLIDLPSYHYTIDGVPSTSLIGQLGCPFACAFCGGRESSMLRRIRTRTVPSILAEVRQLHDTYGFKGAMCYDDELNVSKEMISLMNGLADLGRELGFEWKLRGFVKAELFNEEQAKAMRRAGFRWILTGFESGSPRILTNINKKATREDNTRAVQIAHANGLKVKALMSVGHPGETEETIADTEQWLIENNVDAFDCTVISVFAGTPYHDYAEETSPGIWTFTAPKTGDKLFSIETDWATEENYYKGIPGAYRSFVYTDFLSPERLVELRDGLERRVRERLSIPYDSATPGSRFEASMGQLPSSVYRRSAGAARHPVTPPHAPMLRVLP